MKSVSAEKIFSKFEQTCLILFPVPVLLWFRILIILCCLTEYRFKFNAQLEVGFSCHVSTRSSNLGKNFVFYWLYDCWKDGIFKFHWTIWQILVKLLVQDRYLSRSFGDSFHHFWWCISVDLKIFDF
jgi:hypothetical protein